jgi:hypothetical protein
MRFRIQLYLFAQQSPDFKDFLKARRTPRQVCFHLQARLLLNYMVDIADNLFGTEMR